MRLITRKHAMINQRKLQAGVKLAAVLNEIFKGESIDSDSIPSPEMQ